MQAGETKAATTVAREATAEEVAEGMEGMVTAMAVVEAAAAQDEATVEVAKAMTAIVAEINVAVEAEALAAVEEAGETAIQEAAATTTGVAIRLGGHSRVSQTMTTHEAQTKRTRAEAASALVAATKHRLTAKGQVPIPLLNPTRAKTTHLATAAWDVVSEGVAVAATRTCLARTQPKKLHRSTS